MIMKKYEYGRIQILEERWQHLQIAKGQELIMKVNSSALSSGGSQSCSFQFTIV